MCKWWPDYYSLQSSFAVISFVAFVLNDAQEYTDVADHITLMVGFVAMSCISATYLNDRWIYTVSGQCIASAVVLVHFNSVFGYNGDKLAPSLLLLVITSGFLSYSNELKDKLEFLESIKNKQLQMDLEKVIEVLPEGVLILGDKCKTKLVNN